ncbi:MAG: ABC transporter ATP-binding protein [Sulfurovaceae bacterium]|nr:ABC transporter ATP-binding protein [Sulfurovaceae bacterium]
MNEKILEIKDLSFAYNGDSVLENINLSLNEKDFLAVIGPNGGGKSTLLKLILGILKTKIGTITINGKNSTDDLSKIGYVPQNTNINTSFPIKVIEVVLMGHINAKKPLFGYGKEEIACALGSLAQVGMQEFANTKIGLLSGGQRQRVMIARALCNHPALLLLDEPTASIDVNGQKQIYELLKELNRYMTIIVVSHDISVTLNYANKVAYINKNLTLHNTTNKFSVTPPLDGHFCEVELMQMFRGKNA